MSDITIPSIDATDVAVLGAAPLVVKSVKAIVDKWPALYPWAPTIAAVIGTVIVALSQLIPLGLAKLGVPQLMVEGWIKGGLALAGVASGYADWRESKKIENVKNKAVAMEASPEVVAEEKAKDAGEPPPPSPTPDFNGEV